MPIKISIYEDLPEDVKKYLDTLILSLNFNNSKEIGLLYQIAEYSYALGKAEGFKDCKKIYEQ